MSTECIADTETYLVRPLLNKGPLTSRLSQMQLRMRGRWPALDIIVVRRSMAGLIRRIWIRKGGIGRIEDTVLQTHGLESRGRWLSVICVVLVAEGEGGGEPAPCLNTQWVEGTSPQCRVWLMIVGWLGRRMGWKRRGGMISWWKVCNRRVLERVLNG